jgi:two-component system phosphate regulon sensor histidine kinase PhoR
LKKISNRIILFYSVLVAVMLVSLAIIFNNVVRDVETSVIRKSMERMSGFIEKNLDPGSVLKSRGNEGRIAEQITALSGSSGSRISVIAADGRVVIDSDVKDVAALENHRYRVEIREALEKGSATAIRYSSTLKMDMMYYARKSGDYVIRMSKPLVEIEEGLDRARQLMIFSSAFIIITGIFIVVFISKKVTSPIGETLAFARDFSEGDYSRRVMNYREDEIGQLQKTLNRMADTIVEKIGVLVFEQNKLKTILESIGDGIVVIDESKRILVANRSFRQFFDIGCPVEGRLYFEVIRSRSLNAKIEENLSTGEESGFEERLINGRICEVNISPIRERETLQGILVVLRDVTEKKRIEQIKTDLVGNMSHELKPPITIMKGYLETIRDNMENSRLCADFVDRAIENADRQNAIINDILKLNIIETSSQFSEEDVNLFDIIKGCVEMLNPKALKRNITVGTDMDALNGTIRGNRFLAEEIFFNLIDNAINYNRESGSIFIGAERKGSSTVITVSDTGIGIPADSIDRVFERFYRVDKSRSRATGGTGLGLSIVKHAAELLGWSVSVASRDEGSVFTLEIN